MRLLRYRGADEPVQIRPLNSESLNEWRTKVIGHLNSTDRADRGRYRYETIHAMSDAEPVSREERVSSDTARLERAVPQKPEEPRVVVDQMVRDTVDQWLEWRRSQPDLFWRRIAELRRLPQMRHYKSDEALADDLVTVCRKIEQSEAAETYKRRKLSGGWGAAVILSRDAVSR